MSPLDRPDNAATLAAGLSPTRPLVADPATPGEAALQYHRASGSKLRNHQGSTPLKWPFRSRQPSLQIAIMTQ
jgi:hypothetical protein